MLVAERWSIGIAMALLNCALSSIGFTLQRYSYLLGKRSEAQFRADPEHGHSDDEKRESRYRLFMSVLGMFLYIIAAVPDVISYALVPQVVCTTVACFRLVVVTCLAHFFLREQVHQREIVGMLCCSVGTFLCLRFGPRPSDDDLALTGTLYHPQVTYYVVVGLCILLCLLIAEHSKTFGMPPLPEAVHYTVLPMATGLSFAIEKVFNTEIGFMHPPKTWEDFLSNPFWTACAASIALLGLCDLYLNARGATKMPVQIFLPSAFAFATSLQYFQSVVIFEELKDMNNESLVLSVCGCLASLLGALFIRPKSATIDSGHQLLSVDEK